MSGLGFVLKVNATQIFKSGSPPYDTSDLGDMPMTQTHKSQGISCSIYSILKLFDNWFQYIS